MSIQFVDLEPPLEDFRSAVLAGLAATPKRISPKFFYDAAGSKLFDRICTLPEYYPTRTELQLMADSASAIKKIAGPNRSVIEFGAGSAHKAARLLSMLESPTGYTAIDISRSAVEATLTGLQSDLGTPLDLVGICADFLQPFDPGAGVVGPGPRLCFFPGSTLGNFVSEDAVRFLTNARNLAGDDGAMLIGVDLEKDRKVLHDAYNDAQGVTAQFNLNLLHRMVRDLDAEVNIAHFEHYAFFNEDKKRIEMHLKARQDTNITIGDAKFSIAKGQTIHTENSHKYTQARIKSLAHKAGWDVGQIWSDPQDYFALIWLTPT